VSDSTDNRAATASGQWASRIMENAVAKSEQFPLAGLFDDADAAERAYQSCIARGYDSGEINVVVSEGTRARLLSSDDRIKAELAERKAEGGELGGPTGGRVGLVMTVAAAVGAAVAVPAIGFAAGPVAVALAAAGAAGVAGGFIAALADWGVPKERLHAYESDVRKGAVLMLVRAKSARDARAIGEEWRKLGGRDIHLG
jgi:hypothetical protein